MDNLKLGNSIQYLDKDNKVLAEILFILNDDNTLTVYKTVVDECLKGQGIAGKLVNRVIEYAKINNLKIKATCSYVQHYFEKNPNEIYSK